MIRTCSTALPRTSMLSSRAMRDGDRATSQLKHVLRARNFPEQHRRSPAQEDGQHEGYENLNNCRQIEVKHPILQPENDRVVHQEHAECIRLHGIEHAPARSLESEEKAEHPEYNGHAEPREEEAVDPLIPVRQLHRISQDFALDVDQSPHTAVWNEDSGDPNPVAFCQLAVCSQQTAIQALNTYPRAENEIGSVKQHAAMLYGERSELEPVSRSEVDPSGNVKHGGRGKHHQNEFRGLLAGPQRQAIDRIERFRRDHI